MAHEGMVAPIECGTNAVVGIPARQVPTISRDIGHIRSRGKSIATKEIQHKGRNKKSTVI